MSNVSRSRIASPQSVGILLIVLLTVLAYVPALTADFIWDDDSYVTENLTLRDWDGLKRIWIPRQTPQYYPAVFTTFWVEHQLWGFEPMGYHVVNVLLHALNAVLVWRLAAVLRIPWAWLIGAVFALHPVHVESVAWISERKNVLSGALYLAAALAYLRFDESIGKGRPSAERGSSGSVPWRWYATSLVLFVLALFSKTVTCSLPAALILMMLWQRRTITIARLLPLAPFFVVGLALALNTAHIEREHVGAHGPEFSFAFGERLIIASKALWFYLSKILWPAELMFIYPRWEIDASSWSSLLPLAGCVMAAAMMIVLYMRGWRGPALATAFYAGTVFPALGFVNVYPMLFSFVADHFQYLASLGIIALAIGGVGYWLGSQRIMIGIAAMLLPALALLTWRQAAKYESAETVWRDTIAKNDRAWIAHNHLAAILLQRAQLAIDEGRTTEAERCAAEAIERADAAVRVKPDQHTAHANRSEALRLLGRIESARDAILQAIEAAPWVADHHWNLGRLDHMRGRDDMAAEAFARAVELDPTSLEYRLDLARVLIRQERLEDAATVYRATLVKYPRSFEALGTLGSIAERMGRCEEAIEWYERALDVAGSAQQALAISPRLIRQLISCGQPTPRHLNNAITLSRQLCDATGWEDPLPMELLALSYAAAGRYSEAAAISKRAEALARQIGMNELANSLADRARDLERRSAEK